MKNWFAVLLVTIMAAWGAPAAAQNDDDYEEEEGEPRFALGVGLGLVEPSDDVEPYLNASLRIRIGGSDDDGDRDDSGIRGYLEPEVGYWETSSGDDGGPSGSDLLLGANLVGVMPLGAIDSFFGVGAGVHFVDAQLLDSQDFSGDSETKLGLNAQFGLDVYLSRNVSLFGAGRFDLVQDSEDSVQSKVYLGLRCRF